MMKDLATRRELRLRDQSAPVLRTTPDERSLVSEISL